MGRRDRKEIESRLLVLVVKLAKRLSSNPSLKDHAGTLAERQYGTACRIAARETGLARDALPAKCPFTIEDILDLNFLPEETGDIGARESMAQLVALEAGCGSRI
jgi:hypothetical protein